MEIFFFFIVSLSLGIHLARSQTRNAVTQGRDFVIKISPISLLDHVVCSLGFDTKTRASLAKRLGPTGRDTPAAEGAPRIKDAHWVEPSLVCEVAFTEWTRDGSMRHPRFLGLRPDKAPLDTLRERARSATVEPSAEAEEEGPASAPRGPTTVEARARHRSRAVPKLANPQKVLFPRDGITKRDIWDYYTAIAPAMLPHLAGRPLTLQRYPDGIEGEEWYQQNVPEKAPDFVQLVDVGQRHGAKRRIVCNDVETLQWLANLAALTIHQWCSHVTPDATTRTAIDESLAKPDYVVLDLDPGDGPWSHLVEVARSVRRLLDALHLESAVKTSGKRGVHVVVPIATDRHTPRPRASPSRWRAPSPRCCPASPPSSA